MKTRLLIFSILILGATIFYNFTIKSNEKTAISNANYKVIFYELGSVKCIPCQKMQPVMKSIEEKYGDQVQVIFYDVWTPEGKEKAKKFTFDLIPTQIFTDSKGKELFRHEGFFSEDEIVKILKKNGVN